MSPWPGALLALLALPAVDAPAAVAGDDGTGAVDAGGPGGSRCGPGSVGAGRPGSMDEAGHGAWGEPERAPGSGREGMHWAVGAGGFVGLTGPVRGGLAAEAEVFPRWPLDVPGERVGVGLRWRGSGELARGLVAGGLVYLAGATRPHFTLELHGDIGLVYGPGSERLLLGGGVRTQIGLFGPVALALHGDVYYALKGLRPRPHIVPALTVSLAR